MEETPGFDLGSCEVLVVDEVDRLMDKGFLPQLKMILNDHGVIWKLGCPQDL